MKRNIFSILLILIFIGNIINAQESNTPTTLDSIKTVPLQTNAIIQNDTLVEKPQKVWSIITNVPDNLWQITKSPFQKNNLKGLGIMLATTAVLLPLDDLIYKNINSLSRDNNFESHEEYKTPISLGKARLFPFAQNLNSAFYQLGQGSTSMYLAGGLYLYGEIFKDKSCVHTARDLGEVYLTMGIGTQILKHIFGRQSPLKATNPGGDWHPFPSPEAYQKNSEYYDAMPSGHMATLAATITTLCLNYPEKKWIKYVGGGLMILSGLAMINNGVHWASDYPLAIALGYISAKITFNKNHHKKTIN